MSAGIFSVLMERATNTRNRREREEKKKKVKENLFQHRENRLERKRVYLNIERRKEKMDRETRKREKSVKGWNH